MAIIKLTQRKDLKKLMSYEFHKDGKKDFDPVEPENYLKRLTDAQKKLLTTDSRVKSRHLTAFIIFGDGFIDRPMGATFVTRTMTNRDIVRPNASLAIFYKHQNSDIELVFYTRFLEISYALFSRPAKKIREYCKELDTEYNIVKRKNIKKAIFKTYKELYTVRNLWPVTRIPPSKHTYFFYLKSVDHSKPSSNATVPYITVRDLSGSTSAPFLGRGNTIHGTIDTRGCWMLFRNYLWDWPNENVGLKYIILARAWLYYRIGNGSRGFIYNARTKSQVSAGMGKDLTEKEFTDDSLNNTYFEFLRKFSGVHYNYHSNDIKIPNRETASVMADLNNSRSSFKTNLKEDIDDYWKGETMELSGEKRKVVGYSGYTKTIYVSPSFSNIPSQNTVFTLDNCWTSKPKPEWGPNIFGQTYGYQKPWATVFGFRRTDRFTLDTGDTKKFM